MTTPIGPPLEDILAGVSNALTIKSELEHKLKEINATLDVLEENALALMGEDIENIRVGGRTFYQRNQETFTIADADVFRSWMADNNSYDFLQNRVASTLVKDYAVENDELPPGISRFARVRLGHRS